MGMISNENLNEFLKEVREKAKGDDKLLEQFERCFLNTLETTVRMKEDGTVYVITGDIPAMWLRDSTAQIRPFLFPAKENEQIRQMIAGLVKRQFYAAVINERLGLGICLEFERKNLPYFMQWKSRASGDYVVGLEPANSSVYGRGFHEEQGDLHMLGPFESETMNLTLRILEGEELDEIQRLTV